MKPENSNSNSLSELNSILFETLRGFKDHKIEIEEARTVANLGHVIISNAKAQLEFHRLAGSKPPTALMEGNAEPKTGKEVPNLPSKEKANPDVKEILYDLPADHVQKYITHKKYLNIPEAIVVEGKDKLIQNIIEYNK